MGPVIDTMKANVASAGAEASKPLWWIDAGREVMAGAAGTVTKDWWSELKGLFGRTANCGSSGGVCALYGCASVLTASAIFRALCDLGSSLGHSGEIKRQSLLQPTSKLFLYMPTIIYSGLFLKVCCIIV